MRSSPARRGPACRRCRRHSWLPASSLGPRQLSCGAVRTAVPACDPRPGPGRCGRRLAQHHVPTRCPRPRPADGSRPTPSWRSGRKRMTGPLQIVLGTISVLFLIVASVMAYRAVRAMVRIIRTGQPDGTRFGPVRNRLKVLAIESLGHTRMLKWSAIGAAHWFVFVGFYGLFLTLVEAFGEVWNPAFHLPIIGEFFLWNLFADIIGAGTILGIIYLIYRRQKDHPRRQGRKSRFAGSNEGRGYFVEFVVLTVGTCILLIRALKVSSDLTERSEEHTSELQSRQYLVCRLLLEKKKNSATLIVPL